MALVNCYRISRTGTDTVVDCIVAVGLVLG